MKTVRTNTLSLLLRSVYLKGLIDGNNKTSNMSWEEKILSDIKKVIVPSVDELADMIDKFAEQKNKAELIFGDEFKDLATAIRKLIESRVR